MKITDLKAPGAIFASDISISEIAVTNYGKVTFLIESGEGTAGATGTVKRYQYCERDSY